MEKEFVPYELALKLKELGFNVECLASYNKDEELNEIATWHPDLKYLQEHPKICLAPLWQQAFDWFIVTHQLSGEVYKQYPHANKYYDWCYAIPLSYDRGYDVEGYKTYEEARLECLKELIKIIEDEKI